MRAGFTVAIGSDIGFWRDNIFTRGRVLDYSELEREYAIEDFKNKDNIYLVPYYDVWIPTKWIINN